MATLKENCAKRSEFVSYGELHHENCMLLLLLLLLLLLSVVVVSLLLLLLSLLYIYLKTFFFISVDVHADCATSWTMNKLETQKQCKALFVPSLGRMPDGTMPGYIYNAETHWYSILDALRPQFTVKGHIRVDQNGTSKVLIPCLWHILLSITKRHIREDQTVLLPPVISASVVPDRWDRKLTERNCNRFDAFHVVRQSHHHQLGGGGGGGEGGGILISASAVFDRGDRNWLNETVTASIYSTLSDSRIIIVWLDLAQRKNPGLVIPGAGKMSVGRQAFSTKSVKGNLFPFPQLAAAVAWEKRLSLRLQRLRRVLY